MRGWWLCLLFPGLAHAQKQPVVAVFDLEAPAGVVTAQEQATLGKIIANELAASRRFKLVPPQQVRQALAEKKRESYKDCYDESCQIEIGKELAASHSLGCSLQRLGSECRISLTLYDLRESVTVGAARKTGGCAPEALARLAESAAQELGGAKTSSARDEPSPPPPPPPQLQSTDYAALAAEAEAAQREADRIKEAAEAVRREQEAKLRAEEAAREKVRADRLARLEQAWSNVVKFATTPAMERGRRIGALEQFLKEYATDNPREGEAKDMLAALKAGKEPAGGSSGLKWIKSKVVKLEFTDSEVTVNQYASCVKSGKCTTNGLTKSSYCNWDKKDRGDHPINCVDWHQADAFCKAVGGRLPTDDEWYAEASNRGQWKYPWGNEPVTCDYAVWGDGNNTDGCGRDSTWPVCSKPKGNSVSGLCDMSGGVWEWTSNNENSQRPLRGGSWSFGLPVLLAAAARYVRAPSYRNSFVGFRCVRPPS